MGFLLYNTTLLKKDWISLFLFEKNVFFNFIKKMLQLKNVKKSETVRFESLFIGIYPSDTINGQDF